jgi:chemotaxis protein MotB
MEYRRRKTIDTESRHNDRWMLSYADLVTLLLALFIVLYAASDSERAQKIAKSFAGQNVAGDGVLPDGSVKQEQNEAIQLLENPVLIKKTKMTQTQRGLIVSLSEAGFFAAGEGNVGNEVDTVIKELSDSLKNSKTAIRVEGHTDSTPISNSRYPSNWELSTARASSVLARLIEKGISPERLSAAGYAGFQPVTDNATPENRAQNRRVDIVVLNR